MTRKAARVYLRELDDIELRVGRLERRFPGDAELMDILKDVHTRRVAALEAIETTRAEHAAGTIH